MGERVAVYILSGGRSSRFGTEKARALLGGRPLILHVAEALAPVAAEITVVADEAGKYADLGLRTLADQVPGLGPLGGLITALTDRPEPGWCLVTACDFVGFRPAWVEALLAARREGAAAVAFFDARWQPLFALYHTAALPVALGLLQRGERALWRLLEALGAVAAPPPEDWLRARSVDTPAVLAELEAWLEDV